MPKTAKPKVARRDVTSLFVAAAQELPEVQMILVEGSYPDDACVWTIIDAPPFEDAFRDRVYQAELDAFRQGEEPPVHFHLMNVRELRPDTDLKTVLPAPQRVLYRRKPAQ